MIQLSCPWVFDQRTPSQHITVMCAHVYCSTVIIAK